MPQVALLGTHYPEELVLALNSNGISWKAFEKVSDVIQANHEKPWDLYIVSATDNTNQGLEILKEAKLKYDLEPLLAVMSKQALGRISVDEDLFNDFCLIDSIELEIGQRIGRLLKKFNTETTQALIKYHDLVIDPNIYQVTVKGTVLDLTFMEYQLLTFLVSHPGKVYSREALLSRVWGYEYFGGGRTVDVHIRRLRSKLGEEYSQYIQTVRSVGYKFGKL